MLEEEEEEEVPRRREDTFPVGCRGKAPNLNHKFGDLLSWREQENELMLLLRDFLRGKLTLG